MQPKYRSPIYIGVILLVAALMMGCAASQVQKAAEKSPRQIMMESDWKYKAIVDADFIKMYAKMPQPEGITIIDSRPYKAKYAKGHIPTAINIPDTQFGKLTDRLPQDKNSLLIFYCGGYA